MRYRAVSTAVTLLVVSLLLLSYAYTIESYVSKYRTYSKSHNNCCRRQRSSSINDLSSTNATPTTTSTPYIDALIATNEDIIGRHFFPGHAGGRYSPKIFTDMVNSNKLLAYDLPELDGLDNIHNPEGPLLESLQLASKMFKSYQTWYLVNGSTGGILTAILACCRIYNRYRSNTHNGMSTDPVFIIGRDSHKSVFDGLSLAQCNAVLLPCQYDINEFNVQLGMKLEHIKQALDLYKDRVCGFVMTRPSYQGVAMDSSTFSAIIDLCHQYKVPVIIDEAHGSHLQFIPSKYHMYDAMTSGADISIQSSHKTLTSLSQTGFMHLSRKAFSFYNTVNSDSNSGSHKKGEDSDVITDVSSIVHECYSMLTTTSPNALFLASLDATRAQFQMSGHALVATAVDSVDDIKQSIREHTRDNKCIQLLDDSIAVSQLGLLVDPMRLSLRFPGKNSILIDDELCDKHNLYCELNQEDCITYIISPGSTRQSLLLLKDALLGYINEATASATTAAATAIASAVNKIELHTSLEYLDIKQLATKVSCSIPIDESIGRVSSQTISIYPPGIPLLVRGEVVTGTHIQRLHQMIRDVGYGCTITGMTDSAYQSINVV